MQTFDDVKDEAYYLRHTQLSRYTHAYSITFLMPNMDVSQVTQFPGIYREAYLTNEEDSSFHITHLAGSVFDSCSASGNHSGPSLNTLGFMCAGVTANRGDRGIRVKLTDMKTGRTLTLAHNGSRINPNASAAAQASNEQARYVPLETLVTPGYSYGFSAPREFSFFLERSQRIKVEVLNMENGNINLGNTRVSLAFIGNRYD